jgi:peptidoglycan hydrolase CwlO-like protein
MEIVKSNMMTNAYKNEAMQNARDDMQEVHKRVAAFEKQLMVIDDFTNKILKVEDSLDKKVTKVKKDQVPINTRIQQIFNQIDHFKESFGAINIDLKGRSTKIKEL